MVGYAALMRGVAHVQQKGKRLWGILFRCNPGCRIGCLPSFGEYVISVFHLSGLVRRRLHCMLRCTEVAAHFFIQNACAPHAGSPLEAFLSFCSKS